MGRTILWIDAEDFTDKGQWKLDTQFSHLMGSPYLLACHSPGIPVQDATVDFSWNGDQMARVWVRTKNWLFPDNPGLFYVEVNGQTLSHMLGAAPTHDWYWQIAGDLTLPQGKLMLTLHDKTGYFGRVAAVLITDDMDYVPPRPIKEYIQARARYTGVSLVPKALGHYDIIVAGGGPAGVPAALAAARLGAKTLLISGRSVIGGNASSEAGIGFNGASARQANAREGGIAEEIVRTRFHTGENWQKILDDLCAAEKQLELVRGFWVCQADVRGGEIQSVTAQNIYDNHQIKASAELYIDCTGDGWLGYFAGACYRVGREANWQDKEEFAPASADTLTMSGCILKGYGSDDPGPIFENSGQPCAYKAPNWVPVFPKGKAYGRNIESIGTPWWLEAPNDYDDLYDAEMARDELFRIYLGHFNYLKNLWKEKDKASFYCFKRMPYYDAKRESRRLIGDYVLNQNDCVAGRNFADTVAHAGWPIDLHNPKGIYSGKEGPFFSNMQVPLVKIPFRCLYSKNISNLLFAGRCASVSHIALGTTRVENTIACEGQAVGTAAVLCQQYGITPRQIYKEKIQELQQILIRDDQFIPGVKNTDPHDLALKAKVSASSVKPGESYYEHIGREIAGYELNCQRATFLALPKQGYLESLWTKLDNRTDEVQTVTFHIRFQADPDGYTSQDDVGVCKVYIQARCSDWFEISINRYTDLRYVWLWAETAPGVWWPVWEGAALDHTRSERNTVDEPFINIRNETHCVSCVKPDIKMANCAAENVINGYNRIFDSERYEWVSDPAARLPQWIELSFRQPEWINRIHITFDSDMTNPAMLTPFEAFPNSLVKAYTVVCLVDHEWKEVVRVNENYLRHKIHCLAPLLTRAIRITVTDSGDHETARIQEVRVYGGQQKQERY